MRGTEQSSPVRLWRMPGTAGIRGRWERALPGVLALLLLAAFALRVYGLDRHSLSGDEIWSVLATQATWEEFWSTDPLLDHPPLYFVALRGWLNLVGNSDYTVRFFSAAAGVAMVPLVFALGRRLLTPLAAALAALLAALAFFLILSSQDAKGHMLAATLSVLSVHLLLRVLERGTGRAWGMWVLSAAASIFTEYTTAAIVLFEVLVLSYAVWRGDSGGRLSHRHWLLSHLLLVLLGGGWVLWSRSASFLYTHTLLPSKAAEWRSSLAPLTNLLHYVTEGRLPTDGASSAALLALSGAAMLGLWRLRRTAGAGAVLALYLIVPTLGLLAATWGRQGFAPRHALFLAPALYLAVAFGFTSLPLPLRSLAVAGLILFALTNARTLYSYHWGDWYDPWYARDDFRGATAYLDNNVRDSDTVLVLSPAGLPLLQYYAKRDYDYGSLGSSTSGEAAIANGSLATVWNRVRRLWLVDYQPWIYDPQQRVRLWLDKRGTIFAQASFPYINVRGYSAYPVVSTEQPPVQHAVGATVKDVARLVGYDRDLSEVSHRGRLYVTLYWQALRRTHHSYSVFVHLLDQDGNIVAQKDNRPARDLLPTYMWEDGTYIRDKYRLELTADTSAGTYRLEVGMYDALTGQRLQIAEDGADSIDLGWIELPPNGRGARRPTSR